MCKIFSDNFFLKFITTSLIIAAQFITCAGELRSISIIFTADTHATLSTSDNTPDLWNWAATLLKMKRQEPQLILIDCGDTFQGSAIAAETRGELIAKIFRQLPFDLIIPGNHDFDFGLEQLENLLHQGNLNALAANISPPSSSFQSWKLLERNQLKIAVIGIADLLARPFGKHRLIGYGVGGVAVCLLRFVCSFLSGGLLWGSYAPEGMNMWVYSLVYNAGYMVPNAILTGVLAVLLCKVLDPKTLKPMKK